MAHFSDLSFYKYVQGNPPQTKNVGWLQRGYPFDRASPSEEVLDLLWSFCKVSVMQTRGIHECDLCAPSSAVSALRGGVKLILGSAEIRVFSKENASPLRQRLHEGRSGLLLLRNSSVSFNVYAAPNLVYHYVDVHRYKPPTEFLEALRQGPRPPDQKYFQWLEDLGLQWTVANSGM